MTSQSLRLTVRARAMGRRVAALHRDRDERDAEPEARPRQLAEEVLAALGPGTGDQADVQRHLGHRQSGVAPQQSLGLERAQQLRPAARPGARAAR